MSARAIAIHGNEKSGERRANLEIKSECPALVYTDFNQLFCSNSTYTYDRGLLLLQYSSIKLPRCYKNFYFSSPQDFIPPFINRQSNPLRIVLAPSATAPPASYDRPVADPPKMKPPRELRNRNNIFKTTSFWHERYTVIFSMTILK